MTYLKHDQLIAAMMLAATMHPCVRPMPRVRQETFEEAGYIGCTADADKVDPFAKRWPHESSGCRGSGYRLTAFLRAPRTSSITGGYS
ncbi:hypothetical protein ELH97_13340 [Rhizobium leguminosarum]|jgi:hypothetical protein|uniref:hypothetical protein n=1 Tax=Rhizobium leguminosarum TaxID=384 RepID=UPI001030FA58|nr:hypothetical protein [Rhizobium leguminosarum]TAX39981.1 hypothetical protein ELI05_13870 [Rhizobium leguminosarum]TAX92861.1 hypothetical protein ELH97_13340 [Rhizobium leguminosarum]